MLWRREVDMIRRSGILLALALVATLAAGTTNAQQPAPAAPPGPAPHIKFDAVEVNLGDVVRGQDAVATFTYKNTGSVPLHILSAKPG
jgi:hypothetical protein